MQELSLLPNLLNGNLLGWADKMVEEEMISPKMQAFLKHKEKMKKFQIEIINVVCLGKRLKAEDLCWKDRHMNSSRVRHFKLTSMGEDFKACMSSHELGMELTMVVQANTPYWHQ